MSDFNRLADRCAHELVGVVIGDELELVENRDPHPCVAFAVDLARWAALLELADLVLHSHPDGSPVPSFHDQRQQIATAVPWYVKPRGGEGFYFGDGSPALGLLGRPYRFGATDCFALVRDALRELHGVRIRNHPRAWGYWDQDERPFEDSLEADGFEVVSDSLGDARPGDALLFRIPFRKNLGGRRAPPAGANHCGLVLEGGEMLHHPSPGKPFDPTQASTTVSVLRWQEIPHTVVRYAA